MAVCAAGGLAKPRADRLSAKRRCNAPSREPTRSRLARDQRCLVRGFRSCRFRPEQPLWRSPRWLSSRRSAADLPTAWGVSATADVISVERLAASRPEVVEGHAFRRRARGDRCESVVRPSRQDFVGDGVAEQPRAALSVLRWQTRGCSKSGERRAERGRRLSRAGSVALASKCPVWQRSGSSSSRVST